KEKKYDLHQVQELETSLTKLKNQMAEPLHLEPPAGPSEVEQQLQAEVKHLQKELENLAGQLQAQVETNEGLSHLNREQEEMLWEWKPKLWEEQGEACQSSVQNDHTTISHVLSHNHQLEEQLAELKQMVTPTPSKKGTSLWGREVRGQRQLQPERQVTTAPSRAV
ncbi:hypothetical protein EGK_17847, partial [Macaca mulatta]